MCVVATVLFLFIVRDGAGIFRQIALLSVSERPQDKFTPHRSGAGVRPSGAVVEVIRALAAEIMTLTVQ
jgi:hypothetical protein